MLACGCGPRLYPVLSSLVCVGFFCAGPVRAAVLFWVAGALVACAWCFVVYCVFTGFPCGGTVCCGVLCSGGWGVVIRGGVAAWAGRARGTGGDGAVCGLGLRLRVCGFYVSSSALYYRHSDSPPPIFFLCSLF